MANSTGILYKNCLILLNANYYYSVNSDVYLDYRSLDRGKAMLEKDSINLWYQLVNPGTIAIP